MVADLMPFIRFGTMSIPDIASRVVHVHALHPDDLVQIYAYIGATDDVKKTMAFKYSDQLRRPRRPLHTFGWSSERKVLGSTDRSIGFIGI